MSDYLCNHNANTHWSYPTSAETDAAINHSREAFADFFNASPREVAFGNNMTTITFHISRALGRQWGPGDEIVVTELDHQANVSPWRALAKERGLTIRSVPFDPQSGELIWAELERAVTGKTRLLAIGAASNALGTISPIRDAARFAHSKGALCFVDAVHFAAHSVIDVKEMECDFLVCSPYKFYGPHAGVLYTRADVMSALDVAVDFLASLAPGTTRRERLVGAMSALHSRGEALFERLWSGLNSIKGVRCYCPPPGRLRTPTISFTVAGIASSDVARALARDAIFASNGNFYATGVMERLGHSQNGVVRAGCACYTTDEEIDRLIQSIHRIAGKNVLA
jgi:selenocysteine lyase/cysteine desulfurase